MLLVTKKRVRGGAGMLTAKREIAIPSSTSGLWFPGSNFFGGGVSGLPPPVLSPRSADIKKRQDKLFSQLKDSPESNYELSLTDLIIESDHGSAKQVEVVVEKEENEKEKEKEKKKEAKKLWTSQSERNRRTPMNYNYMARKSITSTRNDGGLLLNMFTPTSLGRSFTWSSPLLYKSSSTKEILRKTSSSSTATKIAMDMREKEGSFNGCWPAFLKRSKKTKTSCK